MHLETRLRLDVGSPIGQCRAVPVDLGPGAPPAILATICADFDVDPYVEMFFFPTDTLKMVLFTVEGEVLWRRDLGPGVVPGVWFCPVFPFDLDGDGVDEIWFVDNVNTQHPLGVSGYRLARLDGRTGDLIAHYPWPMLDRNQALSHVFRHFIMGGHVHGEPVLLTAQGTYGAMHIQGWRPDMQPRWTFDVPADAPGARGSHMTPLLDLRGDGVDVLMWGERAVELDTGRELFCADRDSYRGHSDIVQPLWRDGRWYLYTTREGDDAVSPRVALFDDQGQRVWGAVDYGHMDMGWTARLGDDGEPLAMAIRIGSKTCGPDGRFHQDRDEFVFKVLTGEVVHFPASVYQTLPVDLNGDGYHELVRGIPGGNGEVLNRHGDTVGQIHGTIAMGSKFCALPGEQVLTFDHDGMLYIWADRDACDNAIAQARYANSFYRTNQRLTACGYNLPNLGGL